MKLFVFLVALSFLMFPIGCGKIERGDSAALRSFPGMLNNGGNEEEPPEKKEPPEEESTAQVQGMVFEVVIEPEECELQGLSEEDCLVPIEGATVCALLEMKALCHEEPEEELGFCAVTNLQGLYEIQLPFNGLYDIVTEAEGFDTDTFRVEVEGATRVDIDFRR